VDRQQKKRKKIIFYVKGNSKDSIFSKTRLKEELMKNSNSIRKDLEKVLKSWSVWTRIITYPLFPIWYFENEVGQG